MGARTHQGRDSADGLGERRGQREEDGAHGDRGDVEVPAEFELLVDGLHATVRSIAAGLPAVYGLTWFPTPERTIGGWAEIDGRAERITLVYGEFGGGGPLVAVYTTQGSAEFLAGGLRYGEGTLDPAFALSPEDELPVLRRFEHFTAVPDVTVTVAGADQVFHCRESGAAWYAWADSLPAGVGVVIEAAGIAPSTIALLEIGGPGGLTAFLDGHRALLREAARAG
jgi:hypothetical protein